MLVDPVTVAAASPTPELKFSISSVTSGGTERIDTNGGGYTLITQHAKPKRGGSRHYVQILRTRDAVDPYSGLTRRVTASASFTINRPTFGFSDADLVALAKALSDYRDDGEVTTARLLQFQA
jgi:hypothetical protein